MNRKILITACMVIILPVLQNCKSKNENTGKSRPAVQRGAEQTKPMAEISIYEAALQGNDGQVSLNLAGGIDVNAPDEEGRTPLMYAAFNGHSGIVRKMIEKGAVVNMTDNLGRTALMMASSGPFPETVKLLMANHADPDIADKQEHFTALMFAASEGQQEIVKILLLSGADPGLKDIDGDDAITFARKNGHNETAQIIQSFVKKTTK